MKQYLGLAMAPRPSGGSQLSLPPPPPASQPSLDERFPSDRSLPIEPRASHQSSFYVPLLTPSVDKKAQAKAAIAATAAMADAATAEGESDAAPQPPGGFLKRMGTWLLSQSLLGGADADADLTPEERIKRQEVAAQAKSAFRSMDRNGDGVLSREEILSSCREDPAIRALLGLPATIDGDPFSRLFSSMFSLMDADRSETIDPSEFAMYIARAQAKGLLEPVSSMNKFHKHDADEPPDGSDAAADDDDAATAPGPGPVTTPEERMFADRQKRLEVAASAPNPPLSKYATKADADETAGGAASVGVIDYASKLPPRASTESSPEERLAKALMQREQAGV